MKKIILFAAMALCAVTAAAQQLTYHIQYSYQYDMQKYDYIRRLDYDEGLIVREGEQSITLKGNTYRILSKDRDVNDEKRRSLQYTVADSHGAEYVVCFNVEHTFPAELKYQVVCFSADNPYEWTYYITDSGK